MLWKVRKVSAALRQRSIRAFERLRGKQRVHFLHIGKTGGTAVKSVLEKCPPGGPTIVRVHRHRMRLRDIPRGEGVIFFLRDPISRFVSGFYSRQRRGQPRTYVEWSEGERQAFRRFSTPDELAAALSSPDPEKKHDAEQAMRQIQHVRDSFWFWFGNEQYFRSRACDIFFVGFQETLTRDFARLQALLHLHASARLPADPVAAHQNPPDLDKRLGETARRNLEAFYAADYRFIALCRQIINFDQFQEPRV